MSIEQYVSRMPNLADHGSPACTGQDPELWFAGDSYPDQQALAESLCAGCPARSGCLLRAVTDEAGEPSRMVFGIFGGLFADERSTGVLRAAS